MTLNDDDGLPVLDTLLGGEPDRGTDGVGVNEDPVDDGVWVIDFEADDEAVDVCVAVSVPVADFVGVIVRDGEEVNVRVLLAVPVEVLVLVEDDDLVDDGVWVIDFAPDDEAVDVCVTVSDPVTVVDVVGVIDRTPVPVADVVRGIVPVGEEVDAVVPLTDEDNELVDENVAEPLADEDGLPVLDTPRDGDALLLEVPEPVGVLEPVAIEDSEDVAVILLLGVLKPVDVGVGLTDEDIELVDENVAEPLADEDGLPVLDTPRDGDGLLLEVPEPAGVLEPVAIEDSEDVAVILLLGVLKPVEVGVALTDEEIDIVDDTVAVLDAFWVTD